jgi:hypothetical protein
MRLQDRIPRYQWGNLMTPRESSRKRLLAPIPNQGNWRGWLMKKTESRKSRDTVPFLSRNKLCKRQWENLSIPVPHNYESLTLHNYIYDKSITQLCFWQNKNRAFLIKSLAFPVDFLTSSICWIIKDNRWDTDLNETTTRIITLYRNMITSSWCHDNIIMIKW